MAEEIRLGDVIDDHCSKCRMLTNHSVVAVVNGEVARTRCRTCNYEHAYRKGKGGKKKAATRKEQLFDEVLSKMKAQGLGPTGSDD